MSKKQRLEKQKQRQLEQKRLDELEEQREREESKHKQSRAAKKMRRAAKRGYSGGLMIFLTVLMLLPFLYSGFYYGSIMIIGDFTGLAEFIPAHTGKMFLIADILMLAGIVLSFAGKYIIQAFLTLPGSGLYLCAAQRVISDIKERLEKNYVEPELRTMDKTYMLYFYPIAGVTLFALIILIIALAALIRKKRRQKRERDNAPVRSIVEQ